MLVVRITPTGSVYEESWSEQEFHQWRLGEIDGVRRKETDIDLGLTAWSNQNDVHGQHNELGMQAAASFKKPGKGVYRIGSTGDIVFTSGRGTLHKAQSDMLQAEVERLLFNDEVPQGVVSPRLSASSIT